MLSAELRKALTFEGRHAAEIERLEKRKQEQREREYKERLADEERDREKLERVYKERLAAMERVVKERKMLAESEARKKKEEQQLAEDDAAWDVLEDDEWEMI